MTYRPSRNLYPLLLIFAVAACSSSPAVPKRSAPAAAAKTVTASAVVFPADTGSFSKAEFDVHITQLKKRLPSSDFTIVVQPPFVVVGDEPAEVVKERAEETIKWAVDRLKQDFFTNDPQIILDIWLFKNEFSYKKHTKLLFNDTPTTPYGYYSHKDGALIMNISTGGGTLVHEIVHPFMEANFPACPAWLNEGMGSLYEQCGEQNGHIYGFVNWRLPGLQKAIKADQVPSFAVLTAKDRDTFYGDTSGVNYAQSRYLCHYLQEKGLLVKFYKQFVARQKGDPTGFQTLKAVLGESDMDRFKKKWEKYVLALNEEFRLQ
jgi:hypothetical protein